ncbi:MAG: hypothetical protein HZC36_16775 [Armatimonadetes bacterium]|nr:hypothetical protein [Armatimonadota bacterium]
MKAFLAIPVIASVLFAVAGCSGQTVINPPDKQVQATLSAGTKVPLVLLTDLRAGTADVGAKVALVVSEDIKDSQGRVLVPRGTLAEGEVAESRSEGMLSAAMNRPARLAVRFFTIKPEGQNAIAITAAPKSEGDEVFRFTSENSVPGRLEAEVKNLVDGTQRATVEDLNQALEQFLSAGNAENLRGGAETERALRQLLDATDLKSAKKYLSEDGKSSLDDLGKLLASARSGSITALSTGDIALALNALKELGELAGSIEQGLKGAFRGHTIHAQVGTGVTAYVARDAQVTVRIP